MKADYTFKHACDSCDQRPVIKGTGLCAVCTFGEADSMWEWLWDDVVKVERKQAKRFIIDFLQEVEIVDEKGNVDTFKAILLHLDDATLDKMEELL